MVMETPTPLCVGLEFVRQYYTVLNKAPLHLHRFFSHNSSFLHGGQNSTNEPIIGQADIHKMIMSLNFRDCHAKIRLVDAQATLGNGVVVQVTGELSNNGNPLRRFMQTFVLAPQTPKKYYVHNDIFRYQDEVFCDEKGGEDSGNDVEEEEATLPPQTTFATAPPPPSATVNGSAHPPEPEPVLPPTPQAPTVPPPVTTPVPAAPVVGGGSSPAPVATATPAPVVAPAHSPTPPAPAAPELPPETPPVAEKEEEGWNPAASQEPRWAPSPQEEQSGWVNIDQVEEQEWVSTEESKGSSWEEPESVASQKETPEPDPPQPEPVQQPPSNEPKTFANLFKLSAGSGSAAAAPAAPPTLPAHQPPPPTHTTTPAPQHTHTMNRVEVNNRSPAAPAAGTGPPPTQGDGGFTQRTSRNSQGRGMPRDRYRPNGEENSEMDMGGEEKRRPQVPDSQQIFVGNLPHAAGEEELKAEFSKFGKIVDVRINTTKGKAGHKGTVPNFGFISFDKESAVARVLSNKGQILLNGEHRLNVEEKKARLRTDSGMGRGSSGRGGMGGSGGMRQAPPGGMQGRGGGRPNFRDSNRGGPGGPRGSFIPRR